MDISDALNIRVETEMPPPIPGMRPPLGSPGGPVPAPKSSMGFVMPIYTICIIVFFVYTLSKILFRRTASPYDPVAPDPQFRRRVFRDDSRSSPDKLGKKEADTIVTAISGLVAEVQQQMEASYAQNQQRQDVQDNARPYTNGTILLNSGPVQIVASEYKESKEKTPEPVNEKEATPEPNEAEPTKVVKEPLEPDVVAPEPAVEPKESSPDVREPSPESARTLEQKEAAPETVVVTESTPEFPLNHKHIESIPEPVEIIPESEVVKEPIPETIQQPVEILHEVAKDPIAIDTPLSSENKQSLLEPKAPELTKEIISEATQEPGTLKYSSDTVPTEPSPVPKEPTPVPEELTSEPKGKLPEPEEPSLAPEEPCPESKKPVTTSKESIPGPKEPSSSPENLTPELKEPSPVQKEPSPLPEELTPESKEPATMPKEPIPEPAELTSEIEELNPKTNETIPEPKACSTEPIEPAPESNEAIPEPKEHILELEELIPETKKSLLQAEEFELKDIPDSKQSSPVSDLVIPDSKETSPDTNATTLDTKEPVLDTKEPIPDTIELVLEHQDPTQHPSSELTEPLQELDAPVVKRSPELSLDISGLKEPTSQSRETTPEPKLTTELESIQSEVGDSSAPEGTLIELNETIAEETQKDDDEEFVNLKEENNRILGDTEIHAERDVNDELMKVLEGRDVKDDSKAETTEKFLDEERFVVIQSTPDVAEENKKAGFPTVSDLEEEEIENAAVKVVGMELTAHPADGGAWPQDLRPARPAPSAPATHEAEEVKSIFLETEIPQQSRVLVAQFAEDREESRDKPRPAKHTPLVVSGKMTLSLIQDAPRETPERDPESTLDDFTTASAVTQPAAEKDELESDEEVDEEIEVEEIEIEEEYEEEDEEEAPAPVKTVKK